MFGKFLGLTKLPYAQYPAMAKGNKHIAISAYENFTPFHIVLWVGCFMLAGRVPWKITIRYRNSGFIMNFNESSIFHDFYPYKIAPFELNK